VRIDDKGRMLDETVKVRQGGDTVMASPEDCPVCRCLPEAAGQCCRGFDPIPGT